ncbi:TPM domain-containing protein [Nocardia asteroides]|uniref:TPM domain-containing protein n=1 Tax=Nocardia asteroides TaxID=1824 RepID=UPI001E336B05|nr:TPM domain-containing protein [Nocardia asteroides]UGT60532.1 TPM domain-containing protein [Nocardia asteroides]
MSVLKVRVVLLLAVLFALLPVAPAGAEPPERIGPHVLDRANALDTAGSDRVNAAVDNLYGNHQVRLWVVYVRDFDGMAPQGWAERTAALSGFGSRDLLLAVATEDRAYWFAGEPPSGLSDGELDDVLAERVEPELRAGRWAGAGVAAADGIDGALRGGGVSPVGLVIVLVLVVAAAAGLVVWSRVRRSRRRAAELAAARTLDPDNVAAIGALSLETLHARSREVLVELDDAIRASGEELEIATGEFGATAATPFRTALESARQAASRAFQIRQQLDDAVPETPDEQRTLLLELLGTVGGADRELDGRVAEFDAMRDLLLNGGARLDALTRDLVELTGAVPGAEAELARLTGTYPASTLISVRDNVAAARERITFGERAIDAGRAALAKPVGEQGEAVAAIRGAEAALGQARTLLGAIATAAADIASARAGLPAALAELRADLETAGGLAAHGGQPLAAARTAAQAALAGAEAAAESDPLGAFREVVRADGELDRVIAAATEHRRAEEELRGRLEHALTAARGQIAAAGDFVGTRRGAVDAQARTRLSEAQRRLDEAQRLAAGDPAAALENARAAAELGSAALREAQADVRRWEASRAPSGGSQAGAVLGGILVEGLLRGAAGGGGGYRPRSYGGSSGSRRIGRGGRF